MRPKRDTVLDETVFNKSVLLRGEETSIIHDNSCVSMVDTSCVAMKRKIQINMLCLKDDFPSNIGELAGIKLIIEAELPDLDIYMLFLETFLEPRQLLSRIDGFYPATFSVLNTLNVFNNPLHPYMSLSFAAAKSFAL